MRIGIPAALFLWLVPVLAVAAAAWVGIAPALAIAAILSAAIAAPGARMLRRRLGSEGQLPLALNVALAVAAVAAIFRIATMAVFMADVTRVEYSIEPDEEFRRVHSCLSAYTESARFLDEGEHNIYERELYIPPGARRRIGPLVVDPFHYPPPFMVVPRAIRVVAPDFWDFRRLWFALQALALAGAAVGLAAWIGSHRGAFVLLVGLMVLASPHVAAALQQGNFQLTAIPMATVAFALLLAGRLALGGSLLAYAALGKIFPGILVVLLVTGRQWKPLAWVTGSGVLLLALTLLMGGVGPFRDFATTALPEISSGAAFPQTEMPRHARVNWSFYGETVRLRLLGAEWITQPRGLMLTQIYGIAVVALAGWIGWTRRFDLAVRADRLALLHVALALVSLASFRSPFVGAVYGVIATLWLMGLRAASGSTAASKIAWLAAAAFVGWCVWIIPAPGAPASDAWMWWTGVLTFACIATNAWIAIEAAVVRPDAMSHPVATV